MSDISELKFDDKNFNKHTQRGMGLLENSLQQFGAGRSILIDKNNNIIAGNGIVEAASSVGITKVKVIETDGTELIAVKRKDVALDSAQGREMALADNATAAADLAWDTVTIEEVSQQFDFDPEDWLSDWKDSDIDEKEEAENEDEGPETSRVMLLSVTAYGKSKDEDAVLVRELKQENADKLLGYLSKNEGDAILDRLVEAIENV